MASYLKTYEDDIYFFIPMTSSVADASAKTIKEDANLASAAIGDDDFSNIYIDTITEHVLYECNNKTFRDLKRYFLGKHTLACYDDNYDGTVKDTEDAYIFATVHEKTGLYILTVAIKDNHYIPTQLIDQMATKHLDIYDSETESYISIEEYAAKKYFLDPCGESKCVICLSNEPEDRNELAYMLAAETYVSEHITYKIRQHHLDAFMRNRACYDYYDSYISRSVIAYVFKDYSDDISERISNEASELFVVEIVLFQNTAVLRTNRRVMDEFDNDDDLTNEKIEELYEEFGHTMKFWSSDVFKYTFAQKEADEVIESFGIAATLDDYHRNQQFLDRMIELRGAISAEKSNSMMNSILFIISCIDGGSATLAGVLWILHLFADESKAYYPMLEAFLRASWIFVFVGIALFLVFFISSKLSDLTAKRRKKAKAKAKQNIKNRQKQPR